MIMVMEGHEVFGQLQLRRVDWQQEMFKEEEEPEQGETGPDTVKASSSGQPMEVDDERKGVVPELVTVDATKVTQEREEEGKPSWADVEEDAPLFFLSPHLHTVPLRPVWEPSRLFFPLFTSYLGFSCGGA